MSENTIIKYFLSARWRKEGTDIMVASDYRSMLQSIVSLMTSRQAGSTLLLKADTRLPASTREHMSQIVVKMAFYDNLKSFLIQVRLIALKSADLIPARSLCMCPNLDRKHSLLSHTHSSSIVRLNHKPG